MRMPRCVGVLALLLAASCASSGQQGAQQASAPLSQAAPKGEQQALELELVKGPMPLPQQGAEPAASDVAKLEAELSQGVKVQKMQTPRFSKRHPLFGAFAAGSGPRPKMKSAPFSLSALSKADIPEPLSPADAPVDALPKMETNEAKELFVDWQSGFRPGRAFSSGESGGSYITVRISLQGHAMARLRIGHNEGVVVKGGGGGVYATCRTPVDTFRRIVPARWESIQPVSGGGAKLVVTDAWFDSNSCKASVVRRTEVALSPLVDGTFLAYREACKDCGGGEMLLLLTPHPLHISTAGIGGEVKEQLGSMTKIAVPVRKGGGGSVVARYSGTVLGEWYGAIGRSGELIPSDVVAGIDVAQGVSEDEPLAIAYRSEIEEGAEPDGIPQQAPPSVPVPLPVPQVTATAMPPRLGF